MPNNRAADRTAILAVLTDIFRSVFEDADLELTMETTSDDLQCVGSHSLRRIRA